MKKISGKTLLFIKKFNYILKFLCSICLFHSIIPRCPCSPCCPFRHFSFLPFTFRRFLSLLCLFSFCYIPYCSSLTTTATSNETILKDYPLEPLPLINPTLIEISHQNTEWLNSSEQLEKVAVHNNQVFETKALPIKSIILFFLTTISILLIIKLFQFEKRRHEEVILKKRPREQALHDLNEILKLDLNRELQKDPGAIKKLFKALHKTLRVYLEKEFGINTSQSTNQEIIFFLKTNLLNFDAEMKSSLIAFFQRADLVNFATYTPSETEYREAVNAINAIKVIS